MQSSRRARFLKDIQVRQDELRDDPLQQVCWGKARQWPAHLHTLLSQ